LEHVLGPLLVPQGSVKVRGCARIRGVAQALENPTGEGTLAVVDWAWPLVNATDAVPPKPSAPSRGGGPHVST
jgi:hypothetical protein